MSETPIRHFIYVNNQEKQRKQRNKKKQKTESEKGLFVSLCDGNLSRKGGIQALESRLKLADKASANYEALDTGVQESSTMKLSRETSETEHGDKLDRIVEIVSLHHTDPPRPSKAEPTRLGEGVQRSSGHGELGTRS
ncbi:hypothetical protein VNO77_08160 [Canavalia gladiata]|uniref:Uncharacterized protein n=1 Tax=Canavalia gladiata TaxID=3824 RepID=A0AAN9R0X9_CANGL